LLQLKVYIPWEIKPKVEVPNDAPTLTPITVSALVIIHNYYSPLEQLLLFTIHILATHHIIIMSKNNPLEGLPVNGVFPLSLSTAFVAAVTGKGSKEDVIGMKCTRLLSTSSSLLQISVETMS